MNNLNSYFRYNRFEIDKEIEQMKKDDAYKEDVKKVIVQGQSSEYKSIG